MTTHLLLVAIGPVQDFIAQSRRTRDLWHSSHLLSELSRAAARSLAEQGATLIIPALERGHEDLLPCWGFDREVDDTSEPKRIPPFAIANKILAEIPAHLDPEPLAIACREAARALLRKHAAWVRRNKLDGMLDANVDAAWHEQVDSLLEFTAGWMPTREGEFSKVRGELDAAVSARKQLREFGPLTSRSVRKSSLCGSRDTLIPADAEQRKQFARKHGVSSGEELDAIGLIKRTGGLPDHFTPIINIALSPWLERVDPDKLARCRELCRQENIQRFKQELPCTEKFRFEGSVLMPSREASLEREKGHALSEALREAVRELHRSRRMPDPYVVCLVADGDKMGDAIQGMESAENLRQFSKDLSEFAKGARAVVEQDHRGSLVYAGGDDVLAFLPIDTALACAEALRKSFTEKLGGTGMTLSVGLGVGHTMEAMGELLALGRAAEKLAKQKRNSLAIIVDKRSGGRRSWTSEWSREPAAQLKRAGEQLRSGLSTRKIHEIADVLARLPDTDRGDQSVGFADVLQQEVARLLARVELGSQNAKPSGPDFSSEDGYLGQRRSVSDWINRHLIARELFAHEEST
jgi:CRISPR-associated protein Cmr2